jgi:hypothetical protein
VLNPSDGYGQVNLRTRQHWFNQTAFVAPSAASFQEGNEKRGVVSGPSYNRLDVGIFRFTGERRLSFGATDRSTIGMPAKRPLQRMQNLVVSQLVFAGWQVSFAATGRQG